MYCNNCGKKNSEDSKFCQHCGSPLNKDVEEAPKETKKQAKNKQTENTKSNGNSSDKLWDKFAEVYDAKDQERTKFDALSSIHVWTMLDRLATWSFENFIQDNKDELNNLSYKVIEALKQTYIISALGGYRMWLASALLDDKEELNKFNNFSIDDFVDKWKNYDFDAELKKLSDDLGSAITRYNEWRMNTLMEAEPEIKELKNSTVEKLKTSLLFHTVNGYHAGKIENTFRK